MNANLAAVLYLIAGSLFILSLRGLSSPASSRQGNFFGMTGMAIAVGDDARRASADQCYRLDSRYPRYRASAAASVR